MPSTKNKTERVVNHFVACRKVFDLGVASATRYVNLLGPFTTSAKAFEWKRTVMDSVDELGLHPAEIEVIHRGCKAPGILNQHFGVTNE